MIKLLCQAFVFNICQWYTTHHKIIELAHLEHIHFYKEASNTIFEPLVWLDLRLNRCKNCRISTY